MAVTLEQVRSYLDPEEPDYPAAAAALGPEALPVLETLVTGADPMLASKATYLASLIDAPGAAGVLAAAAHNPDPVVRVAAAAGVRNRPEPVGRGVLVALLGDRDAGVRSTALESVPEDASDTVRQAVAGMVRGEAEPTVRAASRRVLDRLDRGDRQRRYGAQPSGDEPDAPAGGGSIDDTRDTAAEPEGDGEGVGGGSTGGGHADTGTSRAPEGADEGEGFGGGSLAGTTADEGPFGGGSGDLVR